MSSGRIQATGYVVNRPLVAAICLSGFLLLLAFYYPGWMSPDSKGQYADAKSGIYRDVYPVLMAWWWANLNWIHDGPQLMLIENLALYWAGWGFFALAFSHRFGRLAYLVPLGGLWPGLLLTLGWIWKDVFFASLMFCAFGVITNAIYSGARLNWCERIAVFIFAVFAFGVKTNGLTMLPFLFGLWLYVDGGSLYRWPARFAMIGAMTAASVASAKSLTSFDHIVKMNLYQYIFGHDLLGIGVRTGTMLLPRYFTADISDKPEVIAGMYSPTGFIPFAWQHEAFKLGSPDELADLNQRWLSAVWAHPGAYLAHRWDVFASLMGFGETSSTTGVVGFMTPGNPVTEFLWPILIRHPWLFQSWRYAIAFLVAAAFLLTTRRHSPLCLGLGGAVVAFVAPHFFIAPGESFRYLLFANVVTVLLVLIAAGELFTRVVGRRNGRAGSCKVESWALSRNNANTFGCADSTPPLPRGVLDADTTASAEP